MNTNIPELTFKINFKKKADIPMSVLIKIVYI